MPVKAEEKYEATVTSACAVESKEKSTPGLFMEYKTADGNIEKTWYLTPGTADRFAANMYECFGIDAGRWADEEFLLNINHHIAGQLCSITTEKTEYQGKPRVEVKWMNPSRAGRKATRQSISKIAALFGGSSVPDNGPAPFAPVDNFEEPF